MKTNQFNESIRQKLESIQPEPDAGAWERFQAYRQPPTVPLWKTVWAKAAMVFLALGAVAGSVHWAHVRQEAELKQTVRELSRQRDSLLAARPGQAASLPGTDSLRSVVGDQEGPVPEGPDPALPKNGLPVEAESLAEAREPSTVAKPSAAGRESREPVTMAREVPRERTTAPVRSTDSKRQRSLKPDVPTESPLSEGTERIARPRKALPNEGAERSDLTYRRSTPSGQVRRSGDQTQRAATRTPEDVPAESVPAPPKRLAVADVSPLAARPLSLDSLPEPVLRSISYYEAPQRIARLQPTRHAGTLQLAGRLGLASRLAAGQRSARVTGEVRLGERFGLLVGIQTEFVAGPRYFTEQEYARVNRSDFRRQYVPKLPPRYDILNITETHTLVSVPLRVQYYQPFASDWWGVLGVGTDLDLSAKHRIRYDLYDFRPRPSEFGQGEYRATHAVTKLNNVTVSAGVEKRFGRVGLQLTSSWIVPVTKVSYRRSSTSWGGQVGLSYQIGVPRRTRLVPPPS